jgi:hypothetical protein
MGFLSKKKHKIAWAEISFSPKEEDYLELKSTYYVLLRNKTKYPYPNEKIATLSDPVVINSRQVNFAISPKTFSLKKRNTLYSTSSWALEFITSDTGEVKRAYPKGWLEKLEFQEAETGNYVDFFIATDAASVGNKISTPRINLRGPYKPDKSILPPWVMAPEFPPDDMFWRQPGEIWFFYVWLPYWQSLSTEEKQKYLKLWNAPKVWLEDCAYINADLEEAYNELDSDTVKFILNYRK